MHTKITPNPANSTPTPTPKISVCLITYNQKQYIRDALDGILMQKTNFHYELIIHDDASSDGTTAILKEYQAKHEDKITLIIASENKYSKVGFKFIGEVFSFAKGEYISICEGDDYWTDPLKLQKQATILDNNKKYAISIHNAYRFNCENNQQTPFNAKKLPQNMGVRDVLLRGWFSPTASFVFRKKNVIVPSVKDASLDMIILYQNAKRGRIHYSEDISSVYRYAAKNSLTEKYKKNNIELYKRKLQFINYVDKTSRGKYLAYTLIARIRVFASMALNSI